MAEAVDGELLAAVPLEEGEEEGAVVNFVFDANAAAQPPLPPFRQQPRMAPGERENMVAAKERKIAEDIGAAFEIVWPPVGYYQCRLCQTWIELFPDKGKRRTRYFAALHCKGRHFNKPIYRCLSKLCNNYTTTSRKSIKIHQMRRICHNNQTNPGFERTLTPREEQDAADELIAKCWPHVPLPPPKLK